MTETTSVIYTPPQAGLPYLVVTLTEGGIVETSPAATRVEARAKAARKNIVDARAAHGRTETDSKAPA